ncbi:hypothetical protein SS1G_00675 [Sclerotinia sclerotiorum 1980 UF-70]|uniref:Uncharacterized protein n=1 Tax=Sclerotinia sclerotiorum (strain ATCC 18683 / 1980 / Ss-1) TaxID=665079 RepID=A7E5V0_SCLS1|nr:hypothetical protein SS1G_00675 [Sclerotinia sclerotiorum 1980 UF-70]EDN91272.1 hypothetical protein SS1G_00675 [Sclerotinia sclerotiorum 1980 UF-70]
MIVVAGIGSLSKEEGVVQKGIEEEGGAYYANIKFNRTTDPDIIIIPRYIRRSQFYIGVISSHGSSYTNKKSCGKKKYDDEALSSRNL